MRTSIRIGCGAGYSGDRIEPAVELAEQGRLDYLVFECLAERTIALAQLRKAHDPDAGYDPLLAERMRAVLPACAAAGVTIVTNMGAANPVAGAAMVRAVARDLGLAGLPVAAITGDDVLDVVTAAGSRSTRPARRSNRSATPSSRPTPTSAPRRSSTRWRRAPGWW